MAEAEQPGASLSEVARRTDIDRRILCRWKRELAQQAPRFVTVEIVDEIGEAGSMTLLLPANAKVHLAFGVTDMRKGIDGLAMLVQEVLHQDPFSGHLFVFRGRKGNLLKIVFWDGSGLCLFTKRLEQGASPVAAGGGARTDAAADLSAVIVADRRCGLARAATVAARGGRLIAAAE